MWSHNTHWQGLGRDYTTRVVHTKEEDVPGRPRATPMTMPPRMAPPAFTLWRPCEIIRGAAKAPQMLYKAPHHSAVHARVFPSMYISIYDEGREALTVEDR